MKLLLALALFVLAANPARAAAYFIGPVQSTTTGTMAYSMAGYYKIAASSLAITSPSIILDGPQGGVNASSGVFTYGLTSSTITASTATVGTLILNKSVVTNGITAGSAAWIMLGLGVPGQDFSQYIGLGSIPFFAAEPPAYIGYQNEGHTGNQHGTIVFGTRTADTNIKATLRLSIQGSGWVHATSSMTADGGLSTPSSMTASAFFGNGSALTNLSSLAGNGAGVTASTNVTITSTFTVIGAAASIGGSSWSVVGGSETVAFGITANQLTTTSSVTASAFFGNGAGITSAGAISTRQIFLSGSGTYTTPAGARVLRVRMVAGGGGGGAVATNAGGNGNSTEFGTIFVSSGLGGPAGSAATTGGGAGGTGGQGGSGVFVSSSVFRIAGGGGASAYGGGNSAFGGGARFAPNTSSGVNGATNSGGGGSGGNDTGGTGTIAQSAGAGEYAEIYITVPAASYPYIVGAGGTGGAAGTRAGGNGGSGIIIVDEFY